MRLNQTAALAALLSFGLSGTALAHGGSQDWRRPAYHVRHNRTARMYSRRPRYDGRYGAAPDVDPYGGGSPPGLQ